MPISSDTWNITGTINQAKLDFDDFLNFRRLEKGLRTIFIPHSQGVYVSISLSDENNEDPNESNKYFKVRGILDIESLDSTTQELL